MGRYVIIPTRKEKEDCLELTSYFKDAGWEVQLIQNANSMLEAFASGVDKCDISGDDRVIFCHDDIKILLEIETFNDILDAALNTPDVGFVGVAGCSTLGDLNSVQEANWFANVRGPGWQERGGGLVFHGKEPTHMKASYYGWRTRAVLMDGVFLATTGEVLQKISLKKPDVFKSNWHMYDALLTFQTYRKKLKNIIAPIMLLHASGGDYRREYYKEDSEMFMTLFSRELPASVVD